jgi:hypothetical protein
MAVVTMAVAKRMMAMVVYDNDANTVATARINDRGNNDVSGDDGGDDGDRG